MLSTWHSFFDFVIKSTLYVQYDYACSCLDEDVPPNSCNGGEDDICCSPSTVGANSCVGVAGSDACFASGAEFIAPNSCIGTQACYRANSGGQNIGFALTELADSDGNSCLGEEACYETKTEIGMWIDRIEDDIVDSLCCAETPTQSSFLPFHQVPRVVTASQHAAEHGSAKSRT